MSERLQDMIRTYRIKTGRGWKEKLALASGLSPSTITDIDKRGHVPMPENVYRIALACGRTEPEALEIAKSCSGPARETA